MAQKWLLECLISIGLICTGVLSASQVVVASYVVAQATSQKQPPKPAAAPSTQPGPAQPTPPAVQEPLPPAYFKDLVRLSEVMGALSSLRATCNHADSKQWSERMQALLDAEEPAGARRERLAGAFNQTARAYHISHTSCTESTKVAIDQFLTEATNLTAAIKGRFGG